jgi:hypothetical protein
MANENYTNVSSYVNSFKIDIIHVPTKNKISFASFLNSFTDSYKTNFKQYTGYGRMDPVINYQNTARTINISFTVPASSDEDAKNNLNKMSQLIKFQYPEYQNIEVVSGISSPPICKVKFANLINEYGDYLYGYFSGVDFTPTNESGYFIDDNNNLFPKEFKVSLSFTVLHTKAPGWSNNKWISGRFPYANSVNSNPQSIAAAAPEAASAVDSTDPNDAATQMEMGA